VTEPTGYGKPYPYNLSACYLNFFMYSKRVGQTYALFAFVCGSSPSGINRYVYVIMLRTAEEGKPRPPPRYPLAEIEYVRLKFERIVLGHTNAGLDEALAWARSKVSHLVTMGIWSLAEMPSPAASQELNKLSGSPVYGDSAKLALARRARLLGKPQAE